MELAGQLLEIALGSFADGQGGFYDTAADDEPLIFRPADPADNATPSGTFAVAGALLRYSALAGSARHREAAEAALGVLPGIAARYPRAAGAGLAVAEAWLAGPAEIAVVGPPGDERTRALHQTALHAAPPGAVLALGDGAMPAGSGSAGSGSAGSGSAGSGSAGSGSAGSGAAGAEGGVPLLAGRGLVNGAPAAYVCRQFTCQAPVTTPEQLREALATRPEPTSVPGPAGNGHLVESEHRARVRCLRGNMLDTMHSLGDAGRHLWRRIVSGAFGRSARPRHLVPVVISLLAVAGAATGAVLATVGGKPAGVTGLSREVPPQGIPDTRPAPAKITGPVVPMLGGNADGGGNPITVPVARASAASTRTRSARPVPVAPLRGLHQADLLVVAPFSLSRQVLAAVAGQPAVTSAEPIEAAKIKINGAYAAVLGVDSSTFRGYAAPATAASDPLWEGVARGGVAVSYTMGTLDRLSLSGQVTVSGRQPERLPVVAFGTVGIGGVDAVVSDSTARSLGVPAGNAIVVSAPPASVAALVARIKDLLPPRGGRRAAGHRGDPARRAVRGRDRPVGRRGQRRRH